MNFFVCTVTFYFLYFKLSQANDVKTLLNISVDNNDNPTIVLDNKTNNENRSCKFGLIPGIAQMQQSVNLNKLNFFPMINNNEPGDNGFMGSFFEYTCFKNNVWVDSINNKMYSKPDQVIAVIDKSIGILDTNTNAQTSLRDTKLSLEVQAGVEAKDESSGFGFSASAAYTNVRDNLIIKSNIVTMVQSHQQTYEIELTPPFELSYLFNQAISKLPDKYENDPEKYQTVLNTFGTHYFLRGKFGGSIVLKTVFNSNLLELHTLDELKTTISETFDEIARTDTSIDAKIEKIRKVVSNNSSSKFYYIGGQTDLFEKNKISEWSRSVSLKPYLFQGTLIRSIDSLIENDKKSKQMKHAVKIYLACESIVELQNIFKIIKNNHITIFFDETLMKDFEMLQTYFQNNKKSFDSEEMKNKLKMLKDILNNVSLVIEKYRNL